MAHTLGLKLAQVGFETDLQRKWNGQEPHHQHDRRKATPASVLCRRQLMRLAAAGEQANHAREHCERPEQRHDDAEGGHPAHLRETLEIGHREGAESASGRQASDQKRYPQLLHACLCSCSGAEALRARGLVVHQEVNAEVDRHAREDRERGSADDVDLRLDESDEADGHGKAAQHRDHELYECREIAEKHQHHEQRAQSGEDRYQTKVVEDDAVLERGDAVAADDLDLRALGLRLRQRDRDGFGALLDHPGIAEVTGRAAQHDLHGANRPFVVAQRLRPFVFLHVPAGTVWRIGP